MYKVHIGSFIAGVYIGALIIHYSGHRKVTKEIERFNQINEKLEQVVIDAQFIQIVEDMED